MNSRCKICLNRPLKQWTSYGQIRLKKTKIAVCSHCIGRLREEYNGKGVKITMSNKY